MNQPKKQTAVEWLVDELEKHYIINNGILNPTIIMELKRQAKAMEREQIEKAYKAGYDMRDCCNWEGNIPWDYDVKNEAKLKDCCDKILKGGDQ